jgi:hypothetical protein
MAEPKPGQLQGLRYSLKEADLLPFPVISWPFNATCAVTGWQEPGIFQWLVLLYWQQLVTWPWPMGNLVFYHLLWEWGPVWPHPPACCPISGPKALHLFHVTPEETMLRLLASFLFVALGKLHFVPVFMCHAGLGPPTLGPRVAPAPAWGWVRVRSCG